MREQLMDEMLNIKTGEDLRGIHPSFHYHRYEPTPYSALEVLFANYELKSSDRIVDFGCGRGRLNFYLNYFYNATVVGVEMNEIFHQEAVANRENYLKKTKKSIEKIHFYCCLAEEYEVKPLDNRFYFFNPFSVQVFMNVVKNILVSIEESQREIEIILYYPSEDYIYYLENYSSFRLRKEVTLPGLYEKNPNERFLIYRLDY